PESRSTNSTLPCIAFSFEFPPSSICPHFSATNAISLRTLRSRGTLSVLHEQKNISCLRSSPLTAIPGDPPLCDSIGYDFQSPSKQQSYWDKPPAQYLARPRRRVPLNHQRDG